MLPSHPKEAVVVEYHSAYRSHILRGVSHVSARGPGMGIFEIADPEREFFVNDAPVPLAGPKKPSASGPRAGNICARARTASRVSGLRLLAALRPIQDGDGLALGDLADVTVTLRDSRCCCGTPTEPLSPRRRRTRNDAFKHLSHKCVA